MLENSHDRTMEKGPVKFNPIVKSLNREIISNYPSTGKISPHAIQIQLHMRG